MNCRKQPRFREERAASSKMEGKRLSISRLKTEDSALCPVTDEQHPRFSFSLESDQNGTGLHRADFKMESIVPGRLSRRWLLSSCLAATHRKQGMAL